MSESDFKLKINPDAMTLGDLEDFEEGVGVPLHEALKPVQERDDEGNKVFDPKGRPVMTVKVSAKSLRYLVWIVKRAEDPEFTPDDARKVKVSELELFSDEDTKDAEGNVVAPTV